MMIWSHQNISEETVHLIATSLIWVRQMDCINMTCMICLRSVWDLLGLILLLAWFSHIFSFVPCVLLSHGAVGNKCQSHSMMLQRSLPGGHWQTRNRKCIGASLRAGQRVVHAVVALSSACNSFQTPWALAEWRSILSDSLQNGLIQIHMKRVWKAHSKWCNSTARVARNSEVLVFLACNQLGWQVQAALHNRTCIDTKMQDTLSGTCFHVAS